ncbi:MAG: nucleotidyltransferase domain-containing protein [Proteobacteria bacterium]|nr:nucleotidyltransferase domain-containing protein [Pseudomonadota bacterium]
MDRDRVIDLLNEHARDIRARGVTRLALIGSTARGEAQADSDVDVLAEIDPDRVFTLFDLVGLNDFLAEILGRRVDVVLARGLKPRMEQRIRADRVEVF